MAKAKAGKEIIIDPDKPVTIVRGDVRVVFNQKGGVAVYSNSPVTLHPAVNDAAPQLVPAADAPDQSKWLTKEFLASAKQGQVLPDGSVHIKLDDGSHWAIAANVAKSFADSYDDLGGIGKYIKNYGYGDNLGEVGQYIANQNVTKAHGHDDWQMPNSDVGYEIYKAREEGALKDMFSSVRLLWLAEHSSNDAKVQWFDDGSQDGYSRNNRKSACAVRRLDH